MDSAAGAAALLAVIAVSDGLRLLPAGAIVVSHGWLLRGWNVTHVSADVRDRLRLLTWCSPLVLPLVLTRQPETVLPPRRVVARYRARRRRTRGYVLTLRVCGAITLVALVVGIPLLTARSGVWGLLVAVAAVFLLSVVQAILAILAMRQAGRTGTRAAAACVQFCWPFSAPRAAEDVERLVGSDVPPLVLLAEVLPPDDFVRFVRPRLYDALERGADDPEIAQLRRYLGADRTAALTREPASSEDGQAWCPRCGATFARAVGDCSDCVDVALVPRAPCETPSLIIA